MWDVAKDAKEEENKDNPLVPCMTHGKEGMMDLISILSNPHHVGVRLIAGIETHSRVG